MLVSSGFCFQGFVVRVLLSGFCFLTCAGRPCTPLDTCAENARCSDDTGGVCVCQEDYYMVSGRCVPRKPVGEACRDTGQCVRKSACDKGTKTCTCIEGYFEQDGGCQPCE